MKRHMFGKDDWAAERLQHYLLHPENVNYTEEMIKKVRNAKTFGDLVNVIYYDCEVGYNDIGMLLSIINEAFKENGRTPL